MSVTSSRDGNTVTLRDTDRNLTITVRFRAPHPIPVIDARREVLVLDTYRQGGTCLVQDRFAKDAEVEVR